MEQKKVVVEFMVAVIAFGPVVIPRRTVKDLISKSAAIGEVVTTS